MEISNVGGRKMMIKILERYPSWTFQIFKEGQGCTNP